MNLNAKIYIAGHRGLVGSAILRNREFFFAAERPEYVFLAAAKVGGIHANNTYPADFIYDNLRPCSPASWSPPTSPTRWPRSPASSSARATTASTAPTSSR